MRAVSKQAAAVLAVVLDDEKCLKKGCCRDFDLGSVEASACVGNFAWLPFGSKTIAESVSTILSAVPATWQIATSAVSTSAGRDPTDAVRAMQFKTAMAKIVAKAVLDDAAFEIDGSPPVGVAKEALSDDATAVELLRRYAEAMPPRFSLFAVVYDRLDTPNRSIDLAYAILAWDRSNFPRFYKLAFSVDDNRKPNKKYIIDRFLSAWRK